MITLGQVGAGAWGQNHIRTFSNLKDCRLKICCDSNREALQKINAISGRKLDLTTDFKDIIRDKDIDAVVIATSSTAHHALAIDALSSGKHVLVEKPLALSLADGKRMVGIARDNKCILMVGHLLLYHPAVLKLKSYITEGLLGDIYYLYSTRVNLGRVREKESALWSLASHDISVAMFFLDDIPQEVTAKGASYLRKGIEDVTFINLKFKKDILVHIHASWLDPHKIRKFTVVGSKKMAVFDDMERTEKIRIYDKGFDWHKDDSSYEAFLTPREGDMYVPEIDMVEPLKAECQHFLDCIRDNKTPFTPGENGLKVLSVLEACQKSLEKDSNPVTMEGALD